MVRMAETAKAPHVAFITEIRVIGDDGSFAHTLAPPVKITDKDQFSLVIRDGIPMGVTVKRRPRQAIVGEKEGEMTPDEVAALLPCPFCGRDARERDGKIGCKNLDCAAYMLPATREEWNHRSPPAGMVKDAERYRWLRNHGWDNARPIPLGDGLDEAVNAARSREGKEEG